MIEYHVTYIRDSDRTRVVFVIDRAGPFDALTVANERAPVGFRLAAFHMHHGGAIAIPMDGDNYGNDAPRPPAVVSN
jgi:hypothetical protein